MNIVINATNQRSGWHDGEGVPADGDVCVRKRDRLVGAIGAIINGDGARGAKCDRLIEGDGKHRGLANGGTICR